MAGLCFDQRKQHQTKIARAEHPPTAAATPPERAAAHAVIAIL
jgi:hypothetical protein